MSLDRPEGDLRVDQHDVRLRQWRYAMGKWEAYFDESGDDGRSTEFVIRGYILTSENARMMEAEWNGMLGRYGVSAFHMVDVAHRRKEFEGWCKEQSAESGVKADIAGSPSRARFGHLSTTRILINSKSGCSRSRRQACSGQQPRSRNRGTTACRNLAACCLGRIGNCGSLSDQCASVMNQALQPVGCHVQCGIIHRALVSGSGFGTFRL